MYPSFSSRKGLKKIFTSTFVYFCIFPVISFAGIDLISLLPNPIGDDTLGEYIEIRNVSCDSIDLAGYRIFDAK